jgi:hypothetical protein
VHARTCAATALAVALVASCGGHASQRAQRNPSTHVTTPSSPAPPLAPGVSLVGEAKPGVVKVVAAHGNATWRLTNPNALGAPLVFLVIGERPDAWLVQVPTRPNGTTGWVARNDLDVLLNPWALTVSLRRHLLSVFREDKPVRAMRVGVGSPTAPTPTGHYYLTELLQAPDPAGPYGPLAFGVSAFSEVYSEFAGGDGQIGLHGTNEPRSIGRNVSHGCIRVTVANIRWLARTVPTGTPMTITQ